MSNVQLAASYAIATISLITEVRVNVTKDANHHFLKPHSKPVDILRVIIPFYPCGNEKS